VAYVLIVYKQNDVVGGLPWALQDMLRAVCNIKLPEETGITTLLVNSGLGIFVPRWPTWCHLSNTANCHSTDLGLANCYIARPQNHAQQAMVEPGWSFVLGKQWSLYGTTAKPATSALLHTIGM
jgi:hypothetical protein